MADEWGLTPAEIAAEHAKCPPAPIKPRRPVCAYPEPRSDGYIRAYIRAKYAGSEE
jgi:hypothetical protein